MALKSVSSERVTKRGGAGEDGRTLCADEAKAPSGWPRSSADELPWDADELEAASADAPMTVLVESARDGEVST